MHVTVISLGSSAATTLVDGAAGRVAAQFDSSVYLHEQQNDRYVCLLPSSAEDGPLHVRVAWHHARHLPMLKRASPWRIDSTTLICGALEFELRSATRWRTPDIETMAAAAGAHVNLDDWRSHTDKSDALAALLAGTGTWPAFAREALSNIGAWLRETGNDTPTPESLRLMVGLGTGLTPAGDDLLAGLALMLRARGSVKLETLVDAVTPRLNQTHPISAAHLGEALAGRASAPAMDALTGLLNGTPETVESACTRLGHTSGWDMLAGMLLATEAAN